MDILYISSSSGSKKLITHSDLEIQYIGDKFAKVINQYNMTHSIGHKRNLYNNIYFEIEYFHIILKQEGENWINYYNIHSVNIALSKFY